MLLSFSLAGVLPEPESSDERIRVVTHAGTRRQLFQFLDVSSSKNDIVGLERSNQASYNIRHIAAPLLRAVLF
jgi:hypothetical protein